MKEQEQWPKKFSVQFARFLPTMGKNEKKNGENNKNTL
jgi:hypothetical protein